MTQDEKKEDDQPTRQPDPVIKPLPPREVTDDELDTVVGGLASTGGTDSDTCLT